MTPEASNLHDEFGIQWDGEPKMGGGFHVASVGTTWPTEAEAQDAADKALAGRAGLRLVHRVVSDWEPAGDTEHVAAPTMTDLSRDACCWSCTPNYQFMMVCATCGNKRCPRAADHNLACTGSNEPGQEGSAYPV